MAGLVEGGILSPVLGRPDETVGQLRFTGILVTRRVSEGCNSLPRLRVGLPFRQARCGEGPLV